MSYDLLAFDPNSAPRERTEFIEWYHQQAEWSEDHSYQDPSVTTDALRDWYEAIRQHYPNMNGPGAPSNDDLLKPVVEDSLADYSIGKSVIYAAFAWSEAEDVYPVFRNLAVEHRVGFYDVSGDEGEGEIYFPGQELKPASQGEWRRVSRQFKELKNR